MIKVSIRNNPVINILLAFTKRTTAIAVSYSYRQETFPCPVMIFSFYASCLLMPPTFCCYGHPAIDYFMFISIAVRIVAF